MNPLAQSEIITMQTSEMLPPTNEKKEFKGFELNKAKTIAPPKKNNDAPR